MTGQVGMRRVSAISQDLSECVATSEWPTICAVGGRLLRVAEETLAKATALKADALTASLDELEWQRWLSAEPRGYSFVARVVRDVVARDMLTPGQRQRILAVIDS